MWTSIVINQALSVLATLCADPESKTARKVRPLVAQIWARAGEFLKMVPE